MAKRKHGEGTIYKRKNGLWVGELTIGYNDAGKRIKKQFTSMDLSVVQKKMDDEKYLLNRNIIKVSSSITIAEWLTIWLEQYKRRQLKEKSYDNYEYIV